MQGTNVLFGQIAVVFGIVIAGVWGATQWIAAALGYQLRLGSPWFDFYGTPIYQPWRLFEWWFFFDAYAPEVFNTGGMIAGGSGLLAVLVAIGMSIWRSRQARLVTTYGSARWADTSDIREAGLTQPVGVFLGQHDGQYLRHEGPEHVLAFAPTRSGKGVGLVVPTLLAWPASAVIHDIKGENWQITAGWRSRFSHCLLFNPTDSQSAGYNPLLEVRRGAHEVRDVQNIADILVDPEGALERRNHWEKTSHALLVGAILHVLYAGEDKTLRGVANFLSDPACPFELTLHRMMTTPHLGADGNEDRPHPVVASAAREVLNKSDNERSGVLSTAMSFLGLYRDPTVAEVTSRCDWRIADLIAADHPVSLYLVVPPSDISRTKPLIRLILNQIGRRLTESLDGSDGIARRHKLLLMGSGWALFIEAERRAAADYPRSDFPEPLSSLVDQERRAAFDASSSHFESGYHLTLVSLPPEESRARAAKLLYENAPGDGVDWHGRLEAFVAETDRVFDLLDGLMPEITWLDDGQTLTYLHSTISTRRYRDRHHGRWVCDRTDGRR